MVSDATLGQSSRPWIITFAITAVVALAAIVAASMQHQHATQLADSLKAATDSLAAAQQQLAQAQDQLKQQSAQVQQKSAQVQMEAEALRAEARPDLPVSHGFTRNPLLGPGLMLQLRNNSGADLQVAATFVNPPTGSIQHFTITLPPNRLQTFGGRNVGGWVFEPGQTVRLERTGYRPVEFAVPQ